MKWSEVYVSLVVHTADIFYMAGQLQALGQHFEGRQFIVIVIIIINFVGISEH